GGWARARAICPAGVAAGMHRRAEHGTGGDPVCRPGARFRWSVSGRLAGPLRRGGRRFPSVVRHRPSFVDFRRICHGGWGLEALAAAYRTSNVPNTRPRSRESLAGRITRPTSTVTRISAFPTTESGSANTSSNAFSPGWIALTGSVTPSTVPITGSGPALSSRGRGPLASIGVKISARTGRDLAGPHQAPRQVYQSATSRQPEW